MKQLPMLSTDDKLAEIKRLYFQTTRQTIEQDASCKWLFRNLGTPWMSKRSNVMRKPIGSSPAPIFVLRPMRAHSRPPHRRWQTAFFSRAFASASE